MSRRSTAVLICLLITGVCCMEYDDYPEDEQPEEEVDLHVPKFTSQSEVFTAMEGDNVTLPCFVDKLGHTLLLWKVDNKVLYIGRSDSAKDSHYALGEQSPTGYGLIVYNVTAADTGDYECITATQPQIILRHTLKVKYSPVVTTTPKDGQLMAKKGEAATLSCNAVGYPKPRVTWTKKDGRLPYGESKIVSSELEIPHLEPAHTGVYECMADNGVGDPTVATVDLQVKYGPVIDVVTDEVHTGAGHDAELKCKVKGLPQPKVTWRRADGSRDLTGHHMQSSDNDLGIYTLHVRQVDDLDLGVYTCEASNSEGTAETSITLTGKPSAVVITSTPAGDETTSYKLQWHVKSFSPVEEYKVQYKMQRKRVGRLQTKSVLEQFEWQDAVVSASQQDVPEEGSVFKNSYSFSHLEPAAIYEAIVTAKNKHGWSEEQSTTFIFSTANDVAPADLRGGEVLGSKGPNASSRPSSGALSIIVTSCLLLLLI